MPSLLLRATLAALLSLALATPLASAAVPFTDFTPPVADRSAPLFALDGAGKSYAAWIEQNPERIIVGTRPRGSLSYTDRATITTVDPVTPGATIETAPLIASDRAGNLVVVWETWRNGTGTAVIAATRAAGESAFSTPVRLAAPDEYPRYATLGMADDGSALITWTGFLSGTERAVMRRTAGGAFSAPFALFADSAAIDVAVGPDGTMAAVRARRTSSGAASGEEITVFEVVRKAASATAFGAVEELARTESDYEPDANVEVGPDGRVWVHQDRSLGESAYTLYVAAPEQPFAGVCRLEPDSSFALSRSGDMVVAYADTRSNGDVAVVLSRSTGTSPCGGATYGSRIALSGRTRVLSLVALAGPSGASAAWYELESGGPVGEVRAASVTQPASANPGLTVTPVVDTIATGAQGLQDAGIDERGNLIASWSAADGPGAALVDREAPEVAPIILPTTEPGSPLRLSGSARDDYSPAITYEWSIGRPQPFQGPTAFATLTGATAAFQPTREQTGAVTVTLRATDGSGNVGTATAATVLRSPTAIGPKPAPPGIKLAATRLRPTRSGVEVDRRAVSKGRGTTITFTASAAGVITLELERMAKGRTTARGCSTKSKRGARCTVAVPLGDAVNESVPTGATVRRLTGRWGDRSLRPGLYRLTAVLVAQGNQSTPTTVQFRILK